MKEKEVTKEFYAALEYLTMPGSPEEFASQKQFSIEDYEKRLRQEMQKHEEEIGKIRQELRCINWKHAIVDLRVVHYGDQRRFITKNYSIAESVDLTKVKDGFYPYYSWEEWHIEFSTPLEDDRAYCRHDAWGADGLHVAAGKYFCPENNDSSARRMRRDLNTKKPTLGELVAFYTKQGVAPSLLREMERKVYELRAELETEQSQRF